MSKRELTTAVIDATRVWAAAFGVLDGLEKDQDSSEAEESMADANDALLDAHDALEAFSPESKKHPGFTYYDVELGETKVPRARCNFCAVETNPRGSKRHYMSPACKRDHATLVGIDEDAAEVAAQAVCKDLGIDMPPAKPEADKD